MRLLFAALGHLSLLLGIVGIFLPLLPTTPFVLLAAYCYSRGSERFHRWLHSHPRFGRMIIEWQEQRVIRPRIKWIACLMMLTSLSFPLFFMGFHWGLKVAAGSAGGAVLIFIFSRPSQPAFAAKVQLGPTGTGDESAEEKRRFSA